MDIPIKSEKLASHFKALIARWFEEIRVKGALFEKKENVIVEEPNDIVIEWSGPCSSPFPNLPPKLKILGYSAHTFGKITECYSLCNSEIGRLWPVRINDIIWADQIEYKPKLKWVEAEFEELRGLTLVNIERLKDEEDNDKLLFTTCHGPKYKLYHFEDYCCEEVWIEDICGDLNDLLGTPILLAEKVESEQAPGDWNGEYGPGDHLWTFYKLSTNKGSVTIRWLGKSNGYYSRSVNFVKAEQQDGRLLESRSAQGAEAEKKKAYEAIKGVRYVLKGDLSDLQSEEFKAIKLSELKRFEAALSSKKKIPTGDLLDQFDPKGTIAKEPMFQFKRKLFVVQRRYQKGENIQGAVQNLLRYPACSKIDKIKPFVFNYTASQFVFINGREIFHQGPPEFQYDFRHGSHPENGDIRLVDQRVRDGDIIASTIISLDQFYIWLNQELADLRAGLQGIK